MIMIDPVERHLFFEGIFLKYGYDFRQYSLASMNRRLEGLLAKYATGSLLDVLKQLIQSPERFRETLPLLTIHTTEFFRDPMFFRSLRLNVFPVLRTYPSLRIWIAGCSTGEEVVSLAILLKESGLFSRSVIYATDINPVVLKRAREGIYDLSTLQTFARNYVISSGEFAPTDYYTSDYSLVKFSADLQSNVVYSEHNLATDGVFNEAHLILCRNVLIYFSKELQNRVLNLFTASIAHRGFLGIGSKESLRFSSIDGRFDVIDGPNNIYQIKGPLSVDGRGAL